MEFAETFNVLVEVCSLTVRFFPTCRSLTMFPEMLVMTLSAIISPQTLKFPTYASRINIRFTAKLS